MKAIVTYEIDFEAVWDLDKEIPHKEIIKIIEEVVQIDSGILIGNAEAEIQLWLNSSSIEVKIK